MEEDNYYYYEHKFVDHTYAVPPPCDVCSKIMVGIIRQGRKCKRCSITVHARCQDSVKKTCNKILPGCHIFIEKDYNRTTYCDHCGQLMVGMVLQGLHCTECKVNIHHMCEDSTPQKCVQTKRQSILRSPMSSRPYLPEQKHPPSSSRSSFYGTMNVLNSWNNWKNMITGDPHSKSRNSSESSSQKSGQFVEMSQLLNLTPPEKTENFCTQNKKWIAGVSIFFFMFMVITVLAFELGRKK